MTTGRLRPTVQDDEPLPRSRIGEEILGARVHEPVTIPRTSIRGRMRIVSRSEALTAKVQAKAELEAIGVRVSPGEAMGAFRDEWNAELAVQHLAIAVRDMSEGAPLATVAEWRECDDDQIETLWTAYEDLRKRIDPLDETAELDIAELEAMHDAVKKKDAPLLMSFGSRRLVAFVISSAAQPAS